MNIGYARVSTDEQNLDLQVEALRLAGCSLLFEDRVSGAAGIGRTGLMAAMDRCGPGDVLVVWKLDRLGRSLFELLGFAERLQSQGAGLKVLTGQGVSVDTTRPEGRLIFGIFGALAEFERELIRERTKAGMAAARRRGVSIGRPHKLTVEQVLEARHQIATRLISPAAKSRALGVSVTTLRRALRRESLRKIETEQGTAR